MAPTTGSQGRTETHDDTGVAQQRDLTCGRQGLARRVSGLAVPLALVAGGCFRSDTGPAASPSPRPTASSPSASPGSCSAAGLSADLPEQDLPEAVASMRSRIVRTAVACDIGGLEKLALEGSRPFSFSFGAPAGAPGAYWRKLEADGAKPLFFLVKVLAVPHGTQELAPLEASPGTTPSPSPAGPTGQESGYVWPAAATKEVPTDADWTALEQVYPKDQVARMKEDSVKLGIGYLGWRAGITASGDWYFSVQGD